MKQINKEDFIYHETEENGLSKINDNFSEVEVELEKKAKLEGDNNYKNSVFVFKNEGTGDKNFVLERYDNVWWSKNRLRFLRGRGTNDNPAPSEVGDVIGAIAFRGLEYNGSGGFQETEMGRLEVRQLDDRGKFDFDHANFIFAKTKGNVGIGVDNPTEKLDVLGTIKASSFHTKQNSTTNWMNFWKEGETNRIDSYNDSSGFQDLYIRTKNTIFEIGNLGIGTSNPTKKLEVNGETLTKGIYSEHTGQYWSGTFQSALADKSKRWLFGIRGGAGSSKFSFQHYNGSAWLGDLLTLLGSDGGRVGIGQNNPTEKLDVNGSIKAIGLTLSSIPSSPAGLSSGMVYRDGNNLKIIP